MKLVGVFFFDQLLKNLFQHSINKICNIFQNQIDKICDFFYQATDEIRYLFHWPIDKICDFFIDLLTKFMIFLIVLFTKFLIFFSNKLIKCDIFQRPIIENFIIMTFQRQINKDQHYTATKFPERLKNFVIFNKD